MGIEQLPKQSNNQPLPWLSTVCSLGYAVILWMISKRRRGCLDNPHCLEPVVLENPRVGRAISCELEGLWYTPLLYCWGVAPVGLGFL